MEPGHLLILEIFFIWLAATFSVLFLLAINSESVNNKDLTPIDNSSIMSVDYSHNFYSFSKNYHE